MHLSFYMCIYTYKYILASIEHYYIKQQTWGRVKIICWKNGKQFCRYCGWTKSCTSWYLLVTMKNCKSWDCNGINHLPTGAGFLPSTLHRLEKDAGKGKTFSTHNSGSKPWHPSENGQNEPTRVSIQLWPFILLLKQLVISMGSMGFTFQKNGLSSVPT